MITSYSSIIADRANLRKCGINIIYDIPETNLYRFRITMNNKYAEATYSYDGSATRLLPGIEKYEQQVFGAFTEAGYLVHKSNDPWIAPTLYRSIEDVGKDDLSFEVYLNPEEYSGVASEEEIAHIIAIMKKCRTLSKVYISYKSKVYNLTKEEYQKVLEESKDQILLWIKKYLGSGFSINSIGKDFQEIFRIPIIQFEYSSNDYIAKRFAEDLAFEYLESLGFNKILLATTAYGFICSECNNIVTKSRLCPFVKKYTQQVCPKCGGKYIRVI
jgi:hypothetical protein